MPQRGSLQACRRWRSYLRLLARRPLWPYDVWDEASVRRGYGIACVEDVGTGGFNISCDVVSRLSVRGYVDS
ncbi:MAG: hypothetical protein QOI57_386, partial [Rubrobacteraceae bacterium]|nr:hypothetical protein [Rubrobacteraceae bacterium]